VTATQNSKFNPQNLPDFWNRRANAQTEIFEFGPFGASAAITANQPALLTAARLSAGRFSRMDAPDGLPIRIKMVRQATPVDPLPGDLPARLSYTGAGGWITVSAGAWGHGFAHLHQREAVIVLSPELAADARLVSRYFVDHYLLNFLLTDWAMLHASCVLTPDQRQLIVMIAPHNTGKSTTALHLLQAGFTFLADGMALIRPSAGGFAVGGYPIGEVKLRDDVLTQFPAYTGQPVTVREQRKTVVNLRAIHSDRLAENIIEPEIIHLCFVERGQSTRTELASLPAAAAWTRVTPNTVFWDEPARLTHNTDTLEHLLRVANIYRLMIGSDVPGIIAAVRRMTGNS
jgi:hypothetical protein